MSNGLMFMPSFGQLVSVVNARNEVRNDLEEIRRISSGNMCCCTVLKGFITLFIK
jgi:aerobic-type carbon monoxide dehydrogenase small subunit (CoxS/CutS family)